MFVGVCADIAHIDGWTQPSLDDPGLEELVMLRDIGPANSSGCSKKDERGRQMTGPSKSSRSTSKTYLSRLREKQPGKRGFGREGAGGWGRSGTVPAARDLAVVLARARRKKRGASNATEDLHRRG